jgi:signal transduction histidine kinase
MMDDSHHRARLRQRGLSVWLPATLVSILVLATLVGATLGGAMSSLGHERPVGLVLVGMVGLVSIPVAEWAVGARHPRASIGLAVVAIGVTVPFWALWSALLDPLRSGLLGLAPVAIAGASHVAMRWVPKSPDRAHLYLIYGLTLVAVAIQVLGYNPFEDPGCSVLCIDVPAPSGVRATRTAITSVALLTLTAGVVAVGALARSKPRPAPGVVMVGTVSAIVLMVIPWTARWTRWGQRPGNALLLLPLIGGGLIGVAVLAATLRSLQTRRAMARTVDLLNRAEATLGAGAAPIEGLQFSLPDDGRWIDLSGAPVAERPGVDYLLVADSAGPVLRIPAEHTRDAADVFDALTPAARLAVKNAQLTAITRARISDVRASQARVVAAHEAERRRIERDLHDGAQQRLVSASLYLSHARNLRGHDRAALDQAEVPLRQALTGLRRLAHGAMPDVLATGGLGAALPQIAADSPFPVIFDVDDELSVPPDVAWAAYAAAAAVVARAPGRVLVTASRGDVLEVSIHTDDHLGFGDLSGFIDVSDRVGALGGTISVVTNTVTVRLPCGW